MDEPVTVSFAEFLQQLDKMGDDCVNVAKDTITQEAQETYNRIKNNISEKHGGKTGGLSRSLTMTRFGGKKDDRDWFGYKFAFDGYDAKGQSYQKIANTLNIGGIIDGKRGKHIIAPSYFYLNAISPLKGLSGRIINNVDNYIDKSMDKIE